MRAIGAVALAVGMLGACGTQQGPNATDNSPATTSSAGGSVTDQTLTSNVYVYRSGGVAGFRDRLVLSPDGVATLHRHDKAVLRCRVRPEPLQHIAKAAAKAASAKPPSLTGKSATPKLRQQVPDQITITLAVGDAKATGEEITKSDDAGWKALYTSMGKLFQQSLALASPDSKQSVQPTMCDKI